MPQIRQIIWFAQVAGHMPSICKSTVSLAVVSWICFDFFNVAWASALKIASAQVDKRRLAFSVADVWKNWYLTKNIESKVWERLYLVA